MTDIQIKGDILTPLKNFLVDKANIVTSTLGWSETLSDEKIPSEKLVKEALNNKIETSAIKTQLSASLTNNDVLGAKAVYDQLALIEGEIPDLELENITDWDDMEATLEKVANKKTSFGANFANATDTNYPSMSLLKTELYDNSGNSKFAEAVHDHTVSDITDFSTAVSGFEESTNKVTSLSSSSTDTQYPSAKVVYDGLDAKVTGTKLASSAGIESTSSDTEIPTAKAVYDLYNSIPKWEVVPVQDRTALGQLTGQVGKIYLVPSTNGTDNAYDEYFWNDSISTPAFEKFGSIELDISDLVTMSQVVSYIGSNSTISVPTSGADAGKMVLTITEPSNS